ncbi:MAG: class I SAM-dependent methyltransferase [Acidobacteria bacterium]|nr:class I SAM-dependent methyltransferase [Acidobacteriota bacterium]
MSIEEVMDEIRRRAAERKKAHPELESAFQKLQAYPKRISDSPWGDLDVHLHHANLNFNPTQLAPETRFQLIKKLVLRVARIYTHGQVEYNAAVARTLNAMRLWMGEIEPLKKLREEVQKLSQEQWEIIDLVRNLNRIQLEESAILPKYNVHQLNLIRAERRAAGTFLNPLAFAEEFRGSEALVKDKQRPYVELFHHHEPVTDLACGRGEFLELLKEAGLEGIGVEQSPALANYVRSKGLQVVQQDMFNYLDEQENDSMAGIFAAQIIEHLDWPALSCFLASIRQKLAPGGIVVLESINPECFNIYAESLYIDPTHVRPYHPRGIQFLCQNLGFLSAETRYGSPVPEKNRIPYYSPYQDYAVIARR